MLLGITHDCSPSETLFWEAKSMDTNWLTVQEAAKYLKLGRSTVYRLVHEGKLPAHKFGRQWRFDAAELDEWMKSGKFASLEDEEE